jgi:serine/threonine protein phosphatase PrpC
VTAIDGRSTEEVPCPNCGQLVGVWDGFCEACGTELASPVVSSGTPGHVPQCPVCTADPDAPAGGVSPEGYCEACGRKVPSDRDHVEVDLGLLAGISDRGLRHSRNEDAMALATSRTPDGQVAIAVVCDGVSTSPRPDDASLAAAQAAVRELLTAARLGDDPEEASLAAVRLASAALRDLAGPDGAPACTYASAVVSQGGITVCWIGDSRVYWLAAGDEAGHAPVEPDAPTRPVTEARVAMASAATTPSSLLTRDDSLAAELVASGLLSEEDAMASPQAHVITQWLGADSPDLTLHVARFEPAGPGVLLVCSDGLWNYRSEPPDLAGMALPKALTSPLDAAAVLVKFAIDAGGRDNITAVLVPFPLGTP